MNTSAHVNYHIKKQTPQAFEFDVDGIVGNLVSPELVETHVRVKDVRGGPNALEFDKDGIAFLTAATTIHDFETSENWRRVYDAELADLLEGVIGAEEVFVFDHTVRVDDATAERRPARNVHNDYSKEGAEQRLLDLVGEERAADFRAGNYGFVNVWRPIDHVIRTSPLGFIHPSSMQPEDWMNIELIYPDRRGQILGVAENAAHEWFYQSHMSPDEIAIFNIYDNGGRPHLAHSALDLAEGHVASEPRKSIESRTLVRYPSRGQN